MLVHLMVNPGLHLIIRAPKDNILSMEIMSCLFHKPYFAQFSLLLNLQNCKLSNDWNIPEIIFLPHSHFQGLQQEVIVSTQICSWSSVSCWVLQMQILVSFRGCSAYSSDPPPCRRGWEKNQYIESISTTQWTLEKLEHSRRESPAGLCISTGMSRSNLANLQGLPWKWATVSTQNLTFSTCGSLF